MDNALVIFELAHHHYGIDMRRITGILRQHELYQVPGRPAFLAGAIDTGTNLVPVINLRSRLGFSSMLMPAQREILTITVDRVEIGLLIDALCTIVCLPHETITSARRWQGPPSDLIRATTTVGQHQVALLDTSRLLDRTEQARLQAMALRI